MPLSTDIVRCYIGSTEVVRRYRGTDVVWTKPASSTEQLALFGDYRTSNAVILNNGLSAGKTSADTCATAFIEVPLHEDCYFEIEFDSFDDVFSLYADSYDLATYDAPGWWWDTWGGSVYATEWAAGSSFNYGKPEASTPGVTFSSEQTAPWRAHVAYRHATRSFWCRVKTSPSNISDWFGGGNPTTGASPSCQIGGSLPIYVGVSPYSDTGAGHIIHPDNYDGSVVGFRNGIWLP